MTSALTIEFVKQQAEEVFINIPGKHWRFFNKKSLDNFIYYLPQIKGVTERKQILEAINNYLNEIQHGEDLTLDMTMSKLIFETHLYPIAQKFEWRLGFVPIVSSRGILVLLPVFFIFFYIAYMFNHIVCYILLSLFVLYLIRILLKIKNRKVYGLGY